MRWDQTDGGLQSAVPGQEVLKGCLTLSAGLMRHSQEEDFLPTNHDADYAAIIDSLRGILKSLVEDQLVQGALIGSGPRYRELVTIRDIHDLNARIEQEVQSLQQTIREREEAHRNTIVRLTKSVHALEQRLSRTRKKLNETEAENSIDPLTQVYNRRHLDQQLAWSIRAAKTGNSFVLALLDIDDFKCINDTHGHQVGDRVLCGLARTFRSMVRPRDVLARYGGEEFALLLQGAPVETAVERCQHLIETIRSADFRTDSSEPPLRVSVSCGLTDYVQGDSADDVIYRADQALYQAKKRGKNRIEILKA
jgi:diguanylate cyclase